MRKYEGRRNWWSYINEYVNILQSWFVRVWLDKLYFPIKNTKFMNPQLKKEKKSRG